MIFRKSKSGFFSIERVFRTVINYYDKNAAVIIHEMPTSGADPISILKNVLYFTRIRGLCHITGDVHYLAILNWKRTVLTVHDLGSLNSTVFFKRFYQYVFWLLLPCFFVKKITVISEHTKDELIQKLPFTRHKIVVIPNPVSDKFNYHPKVKKSNIPNILFIGTKENKNLERTIIAISGLNCVLTVVGILSEFQKELFKVHRVSFINKYYISDEELIELYKSCDLVCFPSIYEGFGLPILEAQAMGRPVVTSNLGAMKEISNGTACLVNPYDIHSIRRGIERVLGDAKYYDELVESGGRNVMNFHPKVISERYMRVYQEVWEGLA